MATGFQSSRGVIGGRLGEAMAKADPSRAVSTGGGATNPFSGGGSRGGGGGGSSRNDAQGRAEAEARAQAQAKAEAERKKAEEEARKKFEAEQKAKQEKAFSQTTVGQLTSQKDRDNKLVQTYIENEQSKQTISDYERAQEFQRKLNINQQSSAGDSFVAGIIEGKRGRLMSTIEPTFEQVDTAVSSGAVSGSSGLFGVQKLVETKIQKRYEQDYERELKKKIEEEERLLSNKQMDYQRAIDVGGDFSTQSALFREEQEQANERLAKFSEEYSKGWLTGQGSQINLYGQQALELRKDIYAKQEVQRKALSTFGLGAGVGAGIAGGVIGGKALLSKTLGVAFKAGKIGAGKVLGTTVGVAYGLYSTGKAVAKGKQRYDVYRNLGYDTKKSLAFASYAGATNLAPTAFGTGGALVGGLAVAGGVNYLKFGSLSGGLSQAEQKLVNKALSREKAFTTSVKDEILTESQLRKDGLELPSKNINVLGSKKTGTAVRRIDSVINQEGLSEAERKAVSKLKFRAKTYETVNVIDDVVESSSATRVKTGGLLGQKATSLSSFEGRTTGDILKGTRLTITSSGNDGEVFLERVIGKGKVAYGKGLFGTPVRGEISRGLSIKVGGFKTYKGKVVSEEIGLSATTGDQYSLQALAQKEFSITGANRGLFKSGKDALGRDVIKTGVVADVKGTNIFRGLKGVGSSGSKKMQTIFELFGAKPKPKPKLPTTKPDVDGTIVTSSTGQATIVKPVTSNVLVSPPTTLVPPSNSLRNYPTLVGGEGGRSAYAGVVANRIPAFYSDVQGALAKDLSMNLPRGGGITGNSILEVGTIKPTNKMINEIELISIPENRNIISFKPLVETKTYERIGTIIKEKPSQSFIQIPSLREELSFAQPQLTKQRQQQLLRQRLTQKELLLQTQARPFSPMFPRLPVKPFGFITPKMAQFGGQSFGFKQLGANRTRYQPSFTASTLNIRRTSQPILGGALQVRAIISPRAKKKKKSSARKILGI